MRTQKVVVVFQLNFFFRREQLVPKLFIYRKSRKKKKERKKEVFCPLYFSEFQIDQ